MDRKTLCRVNTGQEEDLYLITTVKEEGKEGFALGLCDGTDGWRGQSMTLYVDNFEINACKSEQNYHEIQGMKLAGAGRRGVPGFTLNPAVP